MRKIPTLFARDDTDRRYVTDTVSPDCEWVLAGEGVPTRKYDGTCVMYDGEHWWARREVKPGKTAPDGFVALSTDDVTGKTVGWEPIAQSSHHSAFSTIPASMRPKEAGTYELVGPKVNGNPEGFTDHALIRHGADVLDGVPRDHAGLAVWLLERPYEGVVFHHPDGRMVKIKRRDLLSVTR